MSLSKCSSQSGLNPLPTANYVTAAEHAALVSQIHSASPRRAQELATALLASIRPALIGLARRLPNRGSCEVDDLAQAGYLAILTGLRRFDPTRADFLGWALRDARAGMVREIQRQGFDLHASDRDRAQGVEAPTIYGEDRQSTRAGASRGTLALESNGEGDHEEHLHANLQAAERSDIQVEQAEDYHRLMIALARLTPMQRAVAVRYYGLGQEHRSCNEIRAELRVGQATVRAALDGALSSLRGYLGTP